MGADSSYPPNGGLAAPISQYCLYLIPAPNVYRVLLCILSILTILQSYNYLNNQPIEFSTSYFVKYLLFHAFAYFVY